MTKKLTTRKAAKPTEPKTVKRSETVDKVAGSAAPSEEITTEIDRRASLDEETLDADAPYNKTYGVRSGHKPR